MICPYCSFKDSKVVDKRDSRDYVRRRRECFKCKKRFTTYEKIGSIEIAVVKKDKRREPFSREKLKTGIMKACEKRPVSIEKIDSIVDKIESELRKLKSKEVKSSLIGEKVMKRLKTLDKIAYIRFASVYKEFKDVDDFKKEIREVKMRG